MIILLEFKRIGEREWELEEKTTIEEECGRELKEEGTELQRGERFYFGERDGKKGGQRIPLLVG